MALYDKKKEKAVEHTHNKGLFWWVSSNSHFHILNNITHISTYFFTHIYFNKLQTTILKLLYQTLPKSFCAKAKTKQTSRQFRKYDLTSVV